MSQTDIKPGKPKVLGVDANYKGLLNVEIPLDPHPDANWAAIFSRGPSGVSYSLSMHPPQLVGGKIVIRPPDGDVEKYVEVVKARIDGTNREYAEQVEPVLKARQEAADREKAERQRRIEQAQKRLDGDDE